MPLPPGPLRIIGVFPRLAGAWLIPLALALTFTQVIPVQARESSPGERLLIAHYYSWWDMNDRSDAFRRDRLEGAFYEETWTAAVASNPDWISVTTWNEWVEDSQIEASRSYGSYYLDATRVFVDGWKGVGTLPPGERPEPDEAITDVGTEGLAA